MGAGRWGDSLIDIRDAAANRPEGNEGDCESAQTIELQRKGPTQTDFATFDQVFTFATGYFSLKKKVKKTFEYRAQVAETAACGGQVSDTEKVKVKK